MNFRILLETQAQAQVLKEKFEKLGYSDLKYFDEWAGIYVWNECKNISPLYRAAEWGKGVKTVSFDWLNNWLDEQLSLKTPKLRPMTEDEIFELWKSNGFRLVVKFADNAIDTIIGYDGRFDMCFKFGNGICDYDAILELEYTPDNGATWNKFETEDK